MNRQQMISQLEQVAEWDIIIVGGGATGLGCAVDAASRGYKILLIEQYDFAKGTSSRSTKLIHGGVRYLAQGNIKLVRESLKERELLLKNAPHICHDIPFILPFFSVFEKWYYGLGLKLYDLLSGNLRSGKTRFLSRKETAESLPGINAAKLTGAVLYHDGQFDDSRLAISLAQTAVDHGAVVINYLALTSVMKTNNRITGVIARDGIDNREYALRCKVLINATGVFTDDVMRMDEAAHKQLITVSQGIHLVVDKHFFPGTHAMIIPKTDDGRVLFAVPWHGKIIIGTTDIPVNEVSAEPMPLPEEINYIIKHVNRYLANPICTTDVKAMFAGLRPLLKTKEKKATALLAREHTAMVSSAGMVTITGGKWTTYRIMAKHAVDLAALTAGLEKKDCITESLRLNGSTGDKQKQLSVYGSNYEQVLMLIQEQPELKEPVHPDLPYLKAAITWAVRNEMAMTVEDVLARRTRALVLDAKAAKEAAPVVAALMAKEMNKPEKWILQQEKAFTALANKYLIQ